MSIQKPARLWSALRAALVVGVFALAMPAAAMEMSAGKGDDSSVEVTGAKTDIVFAAAHNVHVAATSSDDVFVAGHDIKLDTGSADHTFAAGQMIRVTGDNGRAFLTAGHDVTFETGSAASDVLAFGNTISLNPTFKVGGSAVVFGQDVHIQAPVGRDLTAGGETVTIDSAVTGNVRVEGRHIIIGPNAKIGGDLSYRAGDKIDISPQATVTGKKVVLPPDEHMHWSHHNGWRGAGVGAMGGLHHRLMHDALGGLAFLVMALVLTAMFPLLMARTGGMLTRNPLMAGLVGLILLIVGPFLIFIVMITIIGLPLAFTLIALYWAAVALGLVGAAAGIASIAGRFGKDGQPNLGPLLLWTLLGGIVLCVLGALPYVGAWVWFIACVFGTGAIAAQGRSLWAKA